ncbi:hypothetical protein GCM10010425_37950 [Streptomyces spororaveus]|uniref:cation-transporting P-type ATPase n=2 Tax=Streptomyces spororaveus TaxID=284039 RepID=UPI0019238989
MAMTPATAEVPVRAPGGLTDIEAERRLAEHGRNETAPATPWPARVLAQGGSASTFRRSSRFWRPNHWEGRALPWRQPPSPVASRRPNSHGTHSEGDDGYGDAHVRARTPRSRR